MTYGGPAGPGIAATWRSGVVAVEPTLRSATRARHLAEVRDLANLLDNSFRIPILNYRFGLDPVLGLVPVVGDLVAFGISAYIIYRAARMGAPLGLLARMTLNALGDTVVGSVPILGTVVDVVWKANSRNLRLLERHLARSG